ncbi:MAG: hypothetical protein K6E49_07470 [Lachnospiraceae bacterium]|nr:hypothetical protein [Lachnospiraceae bacterium]
MKKRLIRTITYILTFVIVSISMSACSVVPSLDISDEQRTLVAEYAAGKLIEYVKGHPGGLMRLDDIDYSQVNPGMQTEEEPAEVALPGLPPDDATGEVPSPDESAPSDEVMPPDDSAATDQEALVDAPDEVPETPSKSPSEALGIEGAELTYDHYEVSDSYPADESELVLSMKAASGKELLIVHFALSNPGAEDLIVHTDSSNFKVRAMLNDTEKLRGDITFLDNDLMNYEGILTPGSTVDTVLVFEMTAGTAIDSLDLLIVDDEGELSYTLV